MGRSTKKLDGAFTWWAKWGADYASKLARKTEDIQTYQTRRATTLEQHAIHGDDALRDRQLAEHDGWLKGREQPCFQEAGYADFLAHYSPPSLAGEVWLAYRRLEGHRTLIVVPMGGAIPGAIPVMFACDYLDRFCSFDTDEYETIFSLWDRMDSIAAEHRNK